MEIPVLVEPVGNNGFRATGLGPPDLVGEGPTREEAIQALQMRLQDRLDAGAEFRNLNVYDASDPWKAMAGILDPDDPRVIAWEQAVADYRDEIEKDPNYL